MIWVFVCLGAAAIGVATVLLCVVADAHATKRAEDSRRMFELAEEIFWVYNLTPTEIAERYAKGSLKLDWSVHDDLAQRAIHAGLIHPQIVM